MLVLRGRLLKLAGAAVVSQSQPVHVEEPGNHALGDFFIAILADPFLRRLMVLSLRLCTCEYFVYRLGKGREAIRTW